MMPHLMPNDMVGNGVMMAHVSAGPVWGCSAHFALRAVARFVGTYQAIERLTARLEPGPVRGGRCLPGRARLHSMARARALFLQVRFKVMPVGGMVLAY